MTQEFEAGSGDGVSREPLGMRSWSDAGVAAWNGGTILVAGGGVFRTDGTAAGTALLAALPAGWPVATSHGVYFAATDDHGWELWRTDGTAAGTQRVTDLAPGFRDGVRGYKAVGDTLFLTASDGTSGFEPWVSDGTAAGTWRLADLWPGLAASDPYFFGVAGDRLLFTGQDRTYGQSLFGVSLRQLGAAHVEMFANGCPIPATRPSLTVPVLPRLGTGTFRFDLRGAAPGTAVVFALGTDANALPLGGCTWWVGGAISTQLTSADPAGSAAWALPVPNQPALIGQRLLAQTASVVPASSPELVLSDALLLVVGR